MSESMMGYIQRRYKELADLPFMRPATSCTDCVFLKRGATGTRDQCQKHEEVWQEWDDYYLDDFVCDDFAFEREGRGDE